MTPDEPTGGAPGDEGPVTDRAPVATEADPESAPSGSDGPMRPAVAESAGPDAGGGSDAAPPEDGAAKDEKPPAARSRWMLEWAIIIVVALVAALCIRAFVFQTFFIPSGSMEPTLHIGDRIVVDKLSYHLHSVDRGDIVVFKRPADEDCGGPPVADLVKRVIGLPTETIQGKDGAVYITGKRLSEPWLQKIPSSYTSDFGPLKVPTGDYFMMGDNRIDSCDSRSWGPLPSSNIVGKVVALVWPLSRLHWF